MGGIVSQVVPLFVAPLVQSAVTGVLGGIRQPDYSQADLLAQQQLEERQRLQEVQQQADINARSAELQEGAAEESRRRRLDLARQIARSRATFASQGIDPNSGSPLAFAEAQTDEAAIEEGEAKDDLSAQLQQLQRSLADAQQSNLLSRTQLQQRQRFNRQTRN